ncbi:hypothetical protein WMY93_015416 [Mugilogobius chulae]|uniref:BED-type domain-containing protein n=1 Tax=Mugilogobius chulae TaxID=88201 RepID=A0AAW0NUP3_9GOBI
MGDRWKTRCISGVARKIVSVFLGKTLHPPHLSVCYTESVVMRGLTRNPRSARGSRGQPAGPADAGGSDSAKNKKFRVRVGRKEGQKSKVWEKFGHVILPDGSAADHVICLACKALYKYDSHKTGTSNLSRHKCEAAANVGTSTSTHAKQPLITTFTANKVPLSVKSKLVDNFVDFCCADLRPFDIVSGKGFTNVAQGLINIGAKHGLVEADSVIPHRQTICDRAKNKAKQEKAALCEAINKALKYGIGITTDMWTDGFHMRSYTALTCHFITEDWTLISRVISTLEFDANEKKTAANIHDQISKELLDIGVSPEHLSRVVFVTDQGPNIKAALKNYSWIPCAAHVLNNVLKHTFDDKNAPAFMTQITSQIVKCKALVTYLKKSGSTLSLPYAVLQECESRWNSKVGMITSVAKQYRQIQELLVSKEQEHRMEGIQLEVLNSLGEFLSVFKDASEELEGDRYPTINNVLLWYNKLKAHCEPRCGDPDYIQYIRQRALKLLQEKLIITTTHKIALFLTPRFKSLKMLLPDERLAVHAEARRLMTALTSPQPYISAAHSMSVEGLGNSAQEFSEEETLEGQSQKRRRLFAEWEDTPELFECDDWQEPCCAFLQRAHQVSVLLAQLDAFWKHEETD